MKLKKTALLLASTGALLVACSPSIQPPMPTQQPPGSPYHALEPLPGGYIAFSGPGSYNSVYDNVYYCDVPVQGSCQGHAETLYIDTDGVAWFIWAHAALTYSANHGWAAQITSTWYFFW